jgi:hypothetical protein
MTLSKICLKFVNQRGTLTYLSLGPKVDVQESLTPMTSSLFKHAFVAVGILFFVALFVIPPAHVRAPSVHGRYFSTSGLVAVLHSIRSFLRSRSSIAFFAICALLINLSSLSRLFLSTDSNFSAWTTFSSPILRC